MTNKEIFKFWNKSSCGEDLFLDSEDINGYTNQSQKRYELEPYILSFAGFDKSKGKKVLEIGVGLGADHQKFAENNSILYGIDLTERAIEHTKKRFLLNNLTSKLEVQSAEELKYQSDYFDIIYSWGVLHHTNRPDRAFKEVFRVLKKNGQLNIMIYNKYSFVILFLWLRYGLLNFKPFMTFDKIASEYLESPGTKVYTAKEIKNILKEFASVNISIELSHGDLLSSHVGQNHRGILLSFAKYLWPRILIKKFFKKFGLFILINAKK